MRPRDDVYVQIVPVGRWDIQGPVALGWLRDTHIWKRGCRCRRCKRLTFTMH